MTRHQLDHEIELYREDDQYVVLMELQGYDREELDLTWRDNHLHVEAQHVDSETGRSEVRRRSLSFPKEIDDEGISASVDEGTLEVHLPISAEDRDTGRQIDISD